MSERTTVLFLVGFMGAGKTTVGRHLARILGWDFVDLDEEIVSREHRDIARIFAEAGEAYFRHREIEILAALRGRARGGTYAQEDSRQLIDGTGTAVWIQVPLEVALRRCAGAATRPLLQGESQAESLYRRRLPSYQSAPLRVDGLGLSAEAIAERIARML